MKALLALGLISTSAYANDYDLVWKARGLKALERAEELVSELKTAGPKKKSQLECELMAERAYMGFSMKETEKIVSKKSGKLQWRILIFGPDMDLQISLMYENDGTKLSGWKVPKMGPGWQVSSARGTDKLLVFGEKCSFALDLERPMSLISIPSEN